MQDTDISNTAYTYIKTHIPDLIEKFASLSTYPPVEKPVTIIMAGSPGAGKTEFSLGLQESFSEFYNMAPESKIALIDADEIRSFAPGYTGLNAHLFQRAAIKGLEKLVDHVFNYSQNAIIDGTFAHFESSIKNIERSVSDKYQRITEIYYIYQAPEIAWDFTKKREETQRRKIHKNTFINSFFSSFENVVKAKQMYGKK